MLNMKGFRKTFEILKSLLKDFTSYYPSFQILKPFEKATKMLEMLPATRPSLPKNVNGFRTTHTCELCGFEPKTKNKYREKQDHLVMKHFKEKIDKIFPHCRPYSCPSAECSFTGKDKQALLRHYTGKHGILERFLREALAEKGIDYAPGENGSKRKSHHHSENGTKAKKMALNIQSNHLSNQHQTTLIDAKDMLPKSPVPITHQQHQQHNQHQQNGNGTAIFRPNSEELRKEVEAMMASFQPQPQQEVVAVNSAPPNGAVLNGIHHNNTVKVTVPALPTAPVPVSMVTTQQTAVPSAVVTSVPQAIDDKKTVILSSKLPNVNLQSQPPSSVVSLIKRSNETHNGIPMATSNDQNGKPTIIFANGQTLHPNHRTINGVQSGQTIIHNGQTIHIPDLILPDQTHNGQQLHAIPIEVITAVAPSSNGAETIITANGTVVTANGQNQVVENEEVMWGAGTLGPAVVVEAAETVPVTYIEASEIVYSAASLDSIDYDYLYPVTTSGPTVVSNAETMVRNSAVRERQLEFNML